MSDKAKQPSFTKLTNLALDRCGAQALYASDDFFAEKENLLRQPEAVFIADKYTDRGKWMDGWESRRKRVEGHDWCVIKLAAKGKIYGVDIDTNHFLGNHPPYASLEAADFGDKEISEEIAANPDGWQEILPKSPLNPGSHNYYEIADSKGDKVIEEGGAFTHVKLHIYPDGGVARLRLFGEVLPDWESLKNEAMIDLASLLNGGRAVACNDMFFSSVNNLILPGRGINMGDGWETKRNRTPGNMDWALIKLGHPGQIKRVLIDTLHFKGNFPHSFSIEACMCTSELPGPEVKWFPLLPKSRLNADSEHLFEKEILINDTVSHAKLCP